MQRIVVIFLFFWLGAATLCAQPYRVLFDPPGETFLLDARRIATNTFDVARYADASLNFPSAVATGADGRELLTAYIKTDSTRSIEMRRSLDGGRTWENNPFTVDQDGKELHSLSLFHLGQNAAPSGGRWRRRRTPAERGNLALFAGGYPIQISSTYTNGKSWSNFHSVNPFGGFRVSSLVRLHNGRLMALFDDDGRFLYPDEEGQGATLRKSVIYKIYSDDGGLTWSDPEIALKHNLHGLYDAVAIYSPVRKDNELILIVSERESSSVYISSSTDEGNSWSYPEKLPASIQGDRFGVATYNRQLLLSYRDMSRTLSDGQPNPTFGDIVLWMGDRRELLRADRDGVKVRIADNYPSTEAMDYNDRNFSDCGYVSVLPLAHRQFCIVASGRWEQDEPPFVRSFLFDPIELLQFINKLK
ncbi:MAG: glycoside hydrolase [Rikenellaceae bacterium]|jgi:hypothetical protein|nr:glycoside hydrolase [Rikenellaceae bacterium]